MNNQTTIDIEKQLEVFRKGIPFVKIIEPASVEKVIHKFTEDEQNHYVRNYEAVVEDKEVVKFVPASGAATRMFKFLHQFLETYHPEQMNIDAFLSNPENKELKLFFESREQFPFHKLIINRLSEKNKNESATTKGKSCYEYVREMLDEKGLNFSNTPKGLIPFHKENDRYLTAFDEQLYESLKYSVSKGKSKVHFTVSPQHEQKFHQRFETIRTSLEAESQISFEVSYSFQKESTDTVAVTLDNQPFVDENGKFLFRPAGHGALLENLNEIDADVIFIKNIDNVAHKKLVDSIGFYKKMLAGKLLKVQDEIFSLLRQLNDTPNEAVIESAKKFIRKEMKLPNVPETQKEIIRLLNRPVRVCGVVKNTGAPGGGPFLVAEQDGTVSYQIVEMSQIDHNHPEQKKLVENATHFNPVDVVCGVRDYLGNKFNLSEFTNPDTGFITEKSYQGQPIKALELPGLWNGSMAKWNTIFVEVPLLTFNPVKTVNDLLNEAHQEG